MGFIKPLSEEAKAYHAEEERKIKDLFKIHRGRINRLDYFLISFFTNALLSAGSILLVKFQEITGIPELITLVITLVLALIVTYVSFSIIAKRLRDIGLSGWFTIPFLLIAGSLYYAVGAVGGWVLTIAFAIPALFIIFWPGQKKDNKHGPYDPVGIFKSPKKPKLEES